MGLCWSKRIDLESIEYESTQVFVLPVSKGKVLKVYDGDTITLGFVFNNTVFRTQVRLLGIDTPEIKSTNEEEKRKALHAREALKYLVLDRVVELQNTKMEGKWGRLLADVYLDTLHVNRRMLEMGHGVPYDGGKKVAVWGDVASV